MISSTLRRAAIAVSSRLSTRRCTGAPEGTKLVPRKFMVRPLLCEIFQRCGPGTATYVERRELSVQLIRAWARILSLLWWCWAGGRIRILFAMAISFSVAQLDDGLSA